jgi:hypothetical protein
MIWSFVGMCRGMALGMAAGAAIWTTSASAAPIAPVGTTDVTVSEAVLEFLDAARVAPIVPVHSFETPNWG